MPPAFLFYESFLRVVPGAPLAGIWMQTGRLICVFLFERILVSFPLQLFFLFSFCQGGGRGGFFSPFSYPQKAFCGFKSHTLQAKNRIKNGHAPQGVCPFFIKLFRRAQNRFSRVRPGSCAWQKAQAGPFGPALLCPARFSFFSGRNAQKCPRSLPNSSAPGRW